MQDEEMKAFLVKNWIEKAEEAHKATIKAIEINELAMAQNRLYYAIFYTVSALAQRRGFITSKHGQLLGWFNKEFIKTGIINRETGRIYRKAFDLRQKSDYEITFKPNKEELENMIKDSREFIEEIKNILIF
ncbi:MAG: HEPN domain-containing protein [bacterium]